MSTSELFHSEQTGCGQPLTLPSLALGEFEMASVDLLLPLHGLSYHYEGSLKRKCCHSNVYSNKNYFTIVCFVSLCFQFGVCCSSLPGNISPEEVCHIVDS